MFWNPDINFSTDTICMTWLTAIIYYIKYTFLYLKFSYKIPVCFIYQLKNKMHCKAVLTQDSKTIHALIFETARGSQDSTPTQKLKFNSSCVLIEEKIKLLRPQNDWFDASFSVLKNKMRFSYLFSQKNFPTFDKLRNLALFQL